MASAATPQGSLRQRNTGSKKSPATSPSVWDEVESKAKSVQKKTKSSETEYRIGLALITVFGFLTRFWGISHPNEVVFDEVHFGKVS